MIKQFKFRFFYLIGFLFITLLVMSIFSLQLGPVNLSLIDVLGDYWYGRESLERLLVDEIRLPRLVLAILVGATLGITGAVMQGLLRNPLADPGILGVTGGAACGAVGVLYFGIAALGWYWLPLAAILGALLALLFVYLLAGANSSLLALALAGVAVSALTSALIAIALNFAPSLYAMQEIVFWLMGSLANRHWSHVAIALPFALFGWLFIFSKSRLLDALTLGEDSARSLGFHVERDRLLLLFGVAISLGACVAVSGSIGFVGLVVPHLLRPFVGYKPTRLIWVSGLGGALLLVLADMTVRQFGTARELKLGVVTALIGAPFFLALILRTRSRWV
jgi:iron complex transport system permease protein